MTLIELCQFVGPQGHVKLSFSRAEGWALEVTISEGLSWATKTQDPDLDALFDKCVQALSHLHEVETQV